MKELIKIQQKLKVSKDTYNAIGGFSFRSAEQILEYVKPFLADEKLAILLTDDMVVLNERYYVKATATLYRENGEEIAHTTAFARETEPTSGKICGAQMTGAASSYARKYALSGLLAIDNDKDPDTQEFTTKNMSQPAAPAPAPTRAKPTAKKSVMPPSAAAPAPAYASEVAKIQSVEELTIFWNNNKELQNNPVFYEAVKARKQEILSATK